ncbi:RNA-binding protein 39 isoform X2 [Lampetra fluviatilis]
MAEDFDIEAMLEAPFQKTEATKVGEANGHPLTDTKKKKSKSRSRSRDKKRSRSRDRRRRKSRERRRRSRSRSRDRTRHREERGRFRSPIYGRKPENPDETHAGQGENIQTSHRKAPESGNEPRPFLLKSRSPRGKFGNAPRPSTSTLTPEERDSRTVFCMQLAARIRAKDLEEFFSAVGKVRDVRLISDRNSRRSKGIAYIEFVDLDSVPLAIGLTGQRLLGVPIIVQASQAEKNRAAAAAAANLQKLASGPMRLYVGSLHFNITEAMLMGIFEPFGKIDNIQLMMDPETGRSKGFGFITFSSADCAKKALEQLNGFELAGRPMKVNYVSDHSDVIISVGSGGGGSSFLDNDELERTGIDLTNTGRLQLMAKLAEGSGLTIPPVAQQALQMNGAIPLEALMPSLAASMNPTFTMSPTIATQCFQLSNMFNPQSEVNSSWVQEIRDDVVEECNKHGGVVHIYVDQNSAEGHVYVKCPNIPVALAAVNSLHGRWFAGKMITAAYVPVPTYHNLFPDSMNALQLLTPMRR